LSAALNRCLVPSRPTLVLGWQPHRPAKMLDVALSFLVEQSMVVVDGDVVIQSA
jgi:hypothetical protein